MPAILRIGAMFLFSACALRILRGALSHATGNGEYLLVFTGSAGKSMAELTGAHFVNEVVAINVYNYDY